MSVLWETSVRSDELEKGAIRVAHRRVGNVVVYFYDEINWANRPARYTVCAIERTKPYRGVYARCTTKREAEKIYNNDAILLLPRGQQT